MGDKRGDLPESVDSAVRLLLGMLSEVEQARIAHMKREELIALDFGLGQWIRNYMGLWGENKALLVATGEEHPDDASASIIHALWTRLQADMPKVQ